MSLRNRGREAADHEALPYESGSDRVAKALVFFGPYLIWCAVVLLAGGILLLP
jgi:hypothetical protein